MRCIRAIGFRLSSLLLLALALLPATDSRAAGHLKSSRGRGWIPLESQHVEAVVRGGLARTTVRQVFVSRHRRPVEAIYEFPIPDGAALVDVAMELGNRRYEGLLLDRKRARRIYDRLVRRRIDPALVEEVSENVFRLSVFPVLPRKKTIVELTWVEAVPRIEGVLRYTYPLRLGDEWATRTRKEFTVSVDFEFTEPYAAVRSATPGMKIENRGRKRARATLRQKDACLDTDVVVEAVFARPTGPEISLSTWRNEAGERWFLAGFAAPSHAPVARPPQEVTFVIDRSASMRGRKLDRALQVTKEQIRDNVDSGGVNILTFAEDVERMAEGVLSGPEARKQATDFLAAIEAGGHTNLGSALEAMATLPAGADGVPSATVLVTDGVPNRGERETNRLVALATKLDRHGHRFYLMPVGTDVDLELLDRIATAGGGELLPATGSVPRILPPVLTDLTISAEGVRLFDVHPHPAGDVPGGRRVFVTGRYEGAGEATVTATGRSAKRSVVLHAPFEFPAEPGGVPLVPFLHAKRKIEDLEAVRPRTPEIEKEILAASLESGVMSSLTSYLVLLPEDRRRLTDPVDESAMADAYRKAWEERNRAIPGSEVETRELEIRDSTMKPKTPGPALGPTGIGGGSAGGRSGRFWNRTRDVLPEFMNARLYAHRERDEVLDGAVRDGLRWLARHQDQDGRWDSNDFTVRCNASLCDGHGRAGADVLITGLAALAWLGNAPATLYYSGTAHDALRWLARQQGQNGAIGDPKAEGFLIAHAVATLAFTEMFAFSGSTDWEHRTRRALEFTARCESKSYRAKLGMLPAQPGMSSDPWTALAAITARASKLKFPMRFSRLLERLPPESALVSWSLLGVNPGKRDRLRKMAGLSRERLQSSDSGADQLFFACLSLRQAQGAGWTECRERVFAPLVARQSEEGDEAGSWAPTGLSGREGGRIASTALSVLILQSRYRYGVMHPPVKEGPGKKPPTLR